MKRAALLFAALLAPASLVACNAVLDLPGDPELEPGFGADASTDASADTSTDEHAPHEAAADAPDGGEATDASGGDAGADAPVDALVDAGPEQLLNARVRDIIVEDGSIFWNEDLDAVIGKMSLDGSNPVTLATGKSVTGFYPSGLATDATHVYWSNVDGQILRCAKAGCQNAPEQVLGGTDSDGGQLYQPYLTGVDTANVYFSNYVGDGVANDAYELDSMPKGGGAVKTLLPGSVMCTTLSRTALVGSFYYYSCEDGQIGRVDTMTAVHEVLAGGVSDAGVVPTAVPDAGAFVVAGNTLYVAQWAESGAIYAVPLSPPGTPTAVAASQAYVNALAADSQRLYWLPIGKALDNGGGSVVRCDIGSCSTTMTTQFKNLDIPQTIVLDGSYVYWSSWGNGETEHSGIWRAPKPQ